MHQKSLLFTLKLLVTALLVLPSSHLDAQNDSLPRLAKGRMDWIPYKKRAPNRMNQKDYSMYMVRVNGLYEWFETEPDQSWIDDFHFFDLNRDRIPDGVFSGNTKYFKGDRTLLMLGDSSLKYPISFSEPGYVHKFLESDSGIAITLVQEPSGLEYRVFVRQYFYAFGTDSARQKWETQYISTTELPGNQYEHQALEVQKPTYMRTSPEILNEPAIDYDQDGKPESLGNIVAELKPGMPLFRLWHEYRDEQSWSFIMLMQIPEGNHLFHLPLRPEVPTAYCGWVLTEAIKQ